MSEGVEGVNGVAGALALEAAGPLLAAGCPAQNSVCEMNTVTIKTDLEMLIGICLPENEKRFYAHIIDR